MRVSILEIARLLDLDDQSFKELVSEGRLDGMKLDESCLQRVRRELFGNKRKPLPKRRTGSHG